jgi:hypothetical protein
MNVICTEPVRRLLWRRRSSRRISDDDKLCHCLTYLIHLVNLFNDIHQVERGWSNICWTTTYFICWPNKRRVLACAENTSGYQPPSTGEIQVEAPRAIPGQSPALSSIERWIVDYLIDNMSIAMSHDAIVDLNHCRSIPFRSLRAETTCLVESAIFLTKRKTKGFRLAKVNGSV